MKEKVTIKPTPTMLEDTGVPPHVIQLNLMTSLLELCQTTLLQINEQTEVVRQTIFALENGQISCHQIVSILDDTTVSVTTCDSRLNGCKLISRD